MYVITPSAQAKAQPASQARELSCVAVHGRNEQAGFISLLFSNQRKL
jgi:hypothetical protein